MKKIRISIIEDNRLLREGLTALLKGEADFTVIGAGSNADSLPGPKELGPEVILLDIGLRSQNSLRVMKSIRRQASGARIIIMDLAPVQLELIEYVRAGASGFVLKDATFHDFLKTIRAVAGGAKVLPAPLTSSLFSQIAEHAARSRKRTTISSIRMTNREREVIDLIAEGFSNKEIAQRLNLATDTIKSHVHNILEKLALHTRLEIASYTHRNRTSGGNPRSQSPTKD
jgi:DNA-binding NarL/FixJ family response regulator